MEGVGREWGGSKVCGAGGWVGVFNGIEKRFLELKGKLSADKKNRPEAPGPLTNQNIRLASSACLRHWLRVH